MEKKRKNIYCPQCKSKVGVYDPKTSPNVKVMCRNCSCLVVYDADESKTHCKKVPDTYTGSGMRFY